MRIQRLVSNRKVLSPLALLVMLALLVAIPATMIGAVSSNQDGTLPQINAQTAPQQEALHQIIPGDVPWVVDDKEIRKLTVLKEEIQLVIQDRQADPDGRIPLFIGETIARAKITVRNDGKVPFRLYATLVTKEGARVGDISARLAWLPAEEIPEGVEMNATPLQPGQTAITAWEIVVDANKPGMTGNGLQLKLHPF